MGPATIKRKATGFIQNPFTIPGFLCLVTIIFGIMGWLITTRVESMETSVTEASKQANKNSNRVTAIETEIKGVQKSLDQIRKEQKELHKEQMELLKTLLER